MAIEDLDLEFEDEEEGKKTDALDVDVDLTFSASPESEVGQAVQGMQGKSAPKKSPTPQQQRPSGSRPEQKATPKNNVADIEQARRTAPRANPNPQSRPTQQAQPMNYANSEVSADVDQLRSEIEKLKGQIQSIQQHADIRVAVAQAERDYLVEYVSNAKLMDHQITGVLQKVSAKVPQLKGEMQVIKRHLREFLAKTQKKDEGGS